MNRRSFMRSILAIAAVVAIPIPPLRRKIKTMTVKYYDASNVVVMIDDVVIKGFSSSELSKRRGWKFKRLVGIKDK